MSYFASPFEVSGVFQESLRERSALLCRGVLSLRRNQRIESLGDRNHQPAPGNFCLCIRDCSSGGSALVWCSREETGRKILTKDSPGPVNMNAIIGDIAPVRGFSVALRSQVFLMRQAGVGHCTQIWRIDFLRACKGVL